MSKLIESKGTSESWWIRRMKGFVEKKKCGWQVFGIAVKPWPGTRAAQFSRTGLILPAVPRLQFPTSTPHGQPQAMPQVMCLVGLSPVLLLLSSGK